MQVFVSIGTPNFRKPYVGLWTWMEEKDNDGVEVDRKQCLYVGDAAGRTAGKVLAACLTPAPPRLEPQGRSFLC